MKCIYGRHTVLELLEQHPDQVSKVYIRINLKDKRINEILIKAKQNKIPIGKVSGKKLNVLSGTIKHQGVLAYISNIKLKDLESILQTKEAKKLLLVLLDQIQDPHNVGAIIRTSECAGVDAVLFSKEKSAPINATVHKTSAGSISHVPLCRVGNLLQTIELLKKRGVWVVGTDSKVSLGFRKFDYKQSIAVVVGSEGDGLRPSVKAQCDELVNIPMLGKTSSLNVSVATGILLYEILRQRGY